MPTVASNLHPRTFSQIESISQSVRVSVDAENKKERRLSVIVPNRNPSISIAGTIYDTVLPILPCNSDPATTNIPIFGKVLSTWCLSVLWIGVMFMSCAISEFEMAPMKENPMYGPSSKVLVTGGAIEPEKLDQGEYWRLLWATQMHAGWIHLFLNVVNYLPLGYIIEPDWGTTKMLAVFICSAITGSLASVLGARSIAVGASGGIFGIMGALIVYILEYWSTIPQAKILLISVFVIISVSIGVSFVPFVDKWAHIGGFCGGLMSSTMLIRDLPEFLQNFLHCRRKSVSNDTERDAEIVQVIRDPIKINRQQSLTDKIRVYRISHDIYADVPAIANPALVKHINVRANRWINIRKAQRSADPRTWHTGDDEMQMGSILVWTIRILAGLCLIGSWLIMIHLRFGLKTFFTPAKIVTPTTMEVIKRKLLSSSGNFMAKFT